MAQPSGESPGPAPDLLRRRKLAWGVALYAVAAFADGLMTFRGVGTDLQLEGNPLMRGAMAQLGVGLGLATQKAAIGAGTILIAIVGERDIRRRDGWIWRVPTTRWVRRWMRQRDRSWIAFIPLYAAIIAQGFAVASWAALALLT